MVPASVARGARRLVESTCGRGKEMEEEGGGRSELARNSLLPVVSPSSLASFSVAREGSFCNASSVDITIQKKGNEKRERVCGMAEEVG